jgi:4-amino-4-deoxy-L-arabinose transferase-like glycosyltransferase
MAADSRTPERRFAGVTGVSGSLSPTMLMIAALVVLRLVAGALLPLSSDEAYYWLWSRHLEAGYLDHPPAIAWLIRMGTSLFGDTSFGVRLGAILSSAAATWFVWRAAADLLRDERAGARAALWFNLTLMVAVEMLAATPDAPALLACAAFLYALLRVRETSDGRWWLIAGIAGGLALLSKFTALFLALGGLGWTIADPAARRWLLSPWTYAGVLVALFLYAPNLVWNAEHGWATYFFQFGRVSRGQFDPRYLVEFLAAQIGLCSPLIFVLGAMGLARVTRVENLRLVAAMLWPGIAYFLVHALHDRVQANWPSFLLPAFSIAAVIAGDADWSGMTRSLAGFTRRAAAPVAAAILVLAYAQAFFGIAPLGRSDPLSRLLGFGLEEAAARVDAIRAKSGARAVLATDYASAAWFDFYLPSHAPIIAASESERWTFLSETDTTLLSGPLLYVAEAKRDEHEALAKRFRQIVPLGEVARKRGALVIGHYVLYRVSDFRGGAFGHQLR